MALREKSSIIDIKYGEDVQALLELDPLSNYQLRNADIALNEKAAFAPIPQFLVSGRLAEFDLLPWKKIKETYAIYSRQINDATNKKLPVDSQENNILVAGLPFRAQFMLDKYKGPVGKEINLKGMKMSGSGTGSVVSLVDSPCR